MMTASGSAPASGPPNNNGGRLSTPQCLSAMRHCPLFPDSHQPGPAQSPRGQPYCCCATVTPTHSPRPASPCLQASRPINTWASPAATIARLPNIKAAIKASAAQCRPRRRERQRNLPRRSPGNLLPDDLRSLQQTAAGLGSTRANQVRLKLHHPRTHNATPIN